MITSKHLLDLIQGVTLICNKNYIFGLRPLSGLTAPNFLKDKRAEETSFLCLPFVPSSSIRSRAAEVKGVPYSHKPLAKSPELSQGMVGGPQGPRGGGAGHPCAKGWISAPPLTSRRAEGLEDVSITSLDNEASIKSLKGGFRELPGCSTPGSVWGEGARRLGFRTPSELHPS